MQTLKGHTNRVHALAFSADGQFLLTGSGDETARLWDLTDGTEVARCHTERHSVLCAHFATHQSPLRALVGTPNRLWLWEPATGRQTLFTPDDGVSALAFAPDGVLWSVGGRGGQGIRRWDPTTWKLLDAWQAEPRPGGCLAFSPGGDLLATGCANGTVLLWDTCSGKVVGSLGQPAPASGPSSPAAADHYISHVAFAGRPEVLVTATSLTLTVWDTTARQALATHRRKGKHYQDLAVSPDGRLLAAANNDATVCFRHLPSLAEQAAYVWKVGPVLTVAFSPDGFRCAAAGRSGKVIVWDVDA